MDQAEDIEQPSKLDNYVFEDRVTIFVETNSANGGVQMCPAIFVPNNSSISTAVKHIYSRLSASAVELDQGIPDVVVSLISTNTVFNSKTKMNITKGLERIVSQCGLWLITCGEQNDVFSSVSTSVVKTVLPTSDFREETLIIVINSLDVTYRMDATTSRRKTTSMTDTSVNTLYFLLNRENTPLKQRTEFRSQAAIKLANPPPALLIGVPYETSYSQSSGSSATSPAIILPNSVKYDRRPLSVTVFAGSSVISIFELRTYLDCGTPCLVVQDSSDLCALLRSSQIFFRSANFNHEQFVVWLRCELRSIMLSEMDSEVDIEEVQKAICQCLRLGSQGLLSFISTESLDFLPEYICEILMKSASGNEDYRQTIELSVKLNVLHTINFPQLGSFLTEENFENLLVEALSRDSRITAVETLLGICPNIHVSPKLLIQWLDRTVDQDFFNTVVVGQALCYSNKLCSFTEDFTNDLDYLLYELSGGFANLFPATYFSQPNTAKDKNISIQILAIWALCLNRTELVKCLWAHSPEPLSLALLLSRISKSLAFEAREFFFYEEQLKKLSKFLTKAACNLLDQAYNSSPRPAYQTLCRKLQYNNQTLSNLAFETNNKEFISHECCQRWVLRLLYGNLQVRQLFNFCCFPRWLKIVVSALLIFPIKLWVTVRPPTSEYSSSVQLGVPKKPLSPTVALLESGKPTKRVRTSSTHSMHSARSYLHKDETTAPSRDERSTLSVGPTTIQLGAETPHSVFGNTQQFFNDETDIMLQSNETQKSSGGNRTSPDFSVRRKIGSHMNRKPGIFEFYKTPIVKYWLSLIFRLAYLAFFAYCVALPGCGNRVLDVILWVWTAFWLMDNVWVIHCRSCHGQLSNMRWSLFDATVVLIFLLTLMLFESAGHLLMNYVSFPSAYLVKVIWSCLLLYQCYSTLFLYIPLSELFGPLMVRIKLMITRDFVNFLILVSLLVCSSAMAVKAVVYPDLEPTVSVVAKSLTWAWMSLFTTDLKALEQSDTCKASLLPSTNRDYCTSISGYGNHQCPANGGASFMIIVEYLIVLKLICWPILFAMFSKTAREVDEEADQIWKYQLYGLAMDFSYRLMLPPPLTPLALFIYACCGERRYHSESFIGNPFKNVDHPDVYRPSRSMESGSGSPGKYSVIYQNPSVPQRKHDPTKHFYSQAALDYWKNYKKEKNTKIEEFSKFKKDMEEKIHYLILASNFNGLLNQLEERKQWNTKDKLDEKRIMIHQKYKSWDVLFNEYNPPEYSKSVKDFPQEIQKFVDHVSSNALVEIVKHWRHKKLHELLTCEKVQIQLSSRGLPLNPSGRTGLSGRGNMVRFGPNRLQFYIIISKFKPGQFNVLIKNDKDLPSKPKYDYNRADDFLSTVLTAVGVPDSNVQILSTRGHLNVDQVDSNVAHVCTQPLQSSEDTDNAWMEADVWAINLTDPVDYQLNKFVDGFTWKEIPSDFPWPWRAEFVTASLKAFSLI